MRIISFFIVVSFLFLVACGQKQVRNKNVSDVRMALTSQDTLQVSNLVVQFMDALKEERYADAVVMLHKVNPESPYSEPELLDNNEIVKAMDRLKLIPIRTYQIKEFNFKISYDNEVKCVVETKSTLVDSKSLMLNFSLKPVRYLGHWSLCLND